MLPLGIVAASCASRGRREGRSLSLAAPPSPCPLPPAGEGLMGQLLGTSKVARVGVGRSRPGEIGVMSLRRTASREKRLRDGSSVGRGWSGKRQRPTFTPSSRGAGCRNDPERQHVSFRPFVASVTRRGTYLDSRWESAKGRKETCCRSGSLRHPAPREDGVKVGRCLLPLHPHPALSRQRERVSWVSFWARQRWLGSVWGDRGRVRLA